MSWNRLAACAALIFCAATAPAAAQPDPRKAALDRDIPKLLVENQVPSVSIAQVENGRLAFAAAYGEQSPGVPATPATLYNVASLSKPLSAEIVLRLASAGKLSLDAPMHPFWVDPDVVGDARHKLLTPRLALSHQTGFPNWRYQQKGKLAFTFTPGEGAGYSGEGYEYAARFAEKKLDEPFEALARRIVFAPLGMTETAYTTQPWFEGRIAPPTAKDGRKLEPVVRTQYSAADDLYTTARDYARFVAGVMEGSGVDRDIEGQRTTVQVSTRAIHCKGKSEADCPSELGFGLGWEILRFGDRTILWHTGADAGEFAVACIDLEAKRATVILTNSRNGFGMVLPVLERVGADPAFLAALRAQAGS